MAQKKEEEGLGGRKKIKTKKDECEVKTRKWRRACKIKKTTEELLFQGFIQINSVNSCLKSTHYLSLVSSHQWLQDQPYSSYESDHVVLFF